MIIKNDICNLCKITNYKNNRNKKQSVVIYNNGKCYCKFHYRIVKETEQEFKDKSEIDILKGLIKEAERLGIKYSL